MALGDQLGCFALKREKERNYQAVKERMWETIKLIAAAKHLLPSTKDGGEDLKPMWASFVKTKTARGEV